MMWTMSLDDLRNFASQFVTFVWQDSSSQKCPSTMVRLLMSSYNRILKIARQCKFPDMDDRIIDAIIFGTNCILSTEQAATDT